MPKAPTIFPWATKISNREPEWPPKTYDSAHSTLLKWKQKISVWSSAEGQKNISIKLIFSIFFIKVNRQARIVLKFASVTSAAVQLKFLFWKWGKLMNFQWSLKTLQNQNYDFSFSVRNFRSLLHEVKTDKKSKSMKKQEVHATYSMLTLLLEVWSVFYLAMNSNGTLGGFFDHLFSIIYASLSFAVHFVATFERFIFLDSSLARNVVCYTKDFVIRRFVKTRLYCTVKCSD